MNPRITINRPGFAAFWVVISSLYAVIFIIAEFWGSPVSGLKGIITLGLQWCVVSGTAAAILGLAAINRVVFAIIFPLIMVYSGIAAYFKLTMGVVISPAMIEVAMVNDLNTWGTVITPALMSVVLISAAAGVLIAVYRWKYVRPTARPLLWCVVLAAIVAIPLFVVKRFRAPVVNRMPISLVTAVDGYLTNRKEIENSRHTFDSVAVSCDAPDDMCVVVVLGESLRADHLCINGYGRNTTPRLAEDSNLISFPDVWSDAYFTHVSIPRIMTRADSAHPDRAYDEQSFITLFSRAGFHTSWLSNQDAVNSYAYFMHEADTLVQCNAGRSLYSFNKWLDADMLPEIERAVGDKGRRLTVVHTIGSHWWYAAHYPDSMAVFRPEADSRIVGELSAEQLINSYDNTILATDDFLAKIIEMLHPKCALMIFISDHGESLGEDGRFLHAADGPELHRPAMLIWYSDLYGQYYPQKVKELTINRHTAISTDHIFHSVLHGTGIGCVADTTMSVFASWKIKGE